MFMMETNKFKATNLYFKGIIINAIPVLIAFMGYATKGGDGPGIGLAFYLLYFIFLSFFYCPYFLLKKERINKKKRRIILFSPFLLSIVLPVAFTIYFIGWDWEVFGGFYFVYAPFILITFFYALYLEKQLKTHYTTGVNSTTPRGGNESIKGVENTNSQGAIHEIDNTRHVISGSK